MRQAQTDLNLSRLLVVHAGGHRYFLADGIEALPLDAALEEIRKTTLGRNEIMPGHGPAFRENGQTAVLADWF
jgi:hypothetical protein